MGYIVVWVLTVAVCFSINTVRKRPSVNPGRVALVVFFAIIVLDLGVMAYVLANATVDLPPEKQGELFGRAVGRSIISLVLSVLLENWFRKKHASVEATVAGAVEHAGSAGRSSAEPSRWSGPRRRGR